MRNKKIIVGITGSIAAYKTAELVSRLRKAGAEVRVIMTKAGSQFMTPLTMQTLSGNRVRTEMFELAPDNPLEHIELARWADLILVAPASANFIARLACGMADDLLSTVCLAASCKIMVAPAMNREMWKKKITKHNVAQLKQLDIQIVGPASGMQACGEEGAGRMVEPEEIVAELQAFDQAQVLTGKRVLITAGPTYEEIDPVRFLGNYSSGKMGFALAQAAVELGAEVILVTGPVVLETPVGVERINIKTAREMRAAVLERVSKADLYISTAAVGDYRPLERATNKIKKTNKNIKLELTPNPDILAEVAGLEGRPIIVGFAAETEQVLENAEKKLKSKQLDLIIANRVGAGRGFGKDEIEVTVCKKDGATTNLPLAPKKKIAQQIFAIIIEMLQ